MGSCSGKDKNMRRGADAAGRQTRQGGGLEEVEDKEEEEGQRSSGHQHTDRSMPVMIAQSQPPPPLG